MSAASCPGVTSTPAAQTSSEVPAPKLLPELFDQVIDHLHDDIPALTRCALVSREWTSTARYHRFNTLKVNLRYDDYTKLGEVLSASPEIRRLVRELWITTPWDDMETLTSPYLGPLTWLPVMEATEELVLKDHTLEDDEQLDYDFRPYLPALKRVHFYAGRLGVGVIDLMSGSFPDMDTLRLTQIGRLIRMPRSRRRSGPQVVVPPPRLHTLDFQNFCPTVLTFTSQWMARHPNANLLSTLHVQCPFVCTREAQPMFDLFGPLRLHSLHIGILTWMDGHKELHSGKSAIVTRRREAHEDITSSPDDRFVEALHTAPRVQHNDSDVRRGYAGVAARAIPRSEDPTESVITGPGKAHHRDARELWETLPGRYHTGTGLERHTRHAVGETLPDLADDSHQGGGRPACVDCFREREVSGAVWTGIDTLPVDPINVGLEFGPVMNMYQ
ncbi:hypothetical protein EVJ58_g3818 [Rhodofomes roseus]|uniref:F-box domain-containing protein n=1 Tax=Rhodofomes roseus TaxID=34475 RepID=A0A4Y9YJE9_9APHY|nr:hypothetical protein EVJ58_g3818 [Rhodofomes roseus]